MEYNYENISLVIPSFQSNDTLSEVLDQCLNLSSNLSIIVVDDGSQPQVKLKEHQSSILLIRNATNLGKGASLKIGIERALSYKKIGVICLDADGQHPPEMIPFFLKFANEHQPDLLIGARSKRFQSMPLDRWLSNTISSALLSLITFKNLSDIQCGYRFIALKQWNSIHAETNGFEWEVQFLIQAIRLKWNIVFLPIPTVYLKMGKSSIRKGRDTVHFLRMMFNEFVLKRFFYNSGSGAAR